MGLDMNMQIVGDCTFWLAFVPSVDMLFVRFLEKHVDGQSISGCIIYLIDFLPRGSLLQTYTLIHDRLQAMWNNFTISFFFYPKLKGS